MSQALLSTRLVTLQKAGLVVRPAGEGTDPLFRLTTAGRELAPVVESLGQWGQRWLPAPRSRDLNPGLLVFAINREIDRSQLPTSPITVQITFVDGTPPRHWWLLLGHDAVAPLRMHPRRPVQVHLECTCSGLAGVWQGPLSWLQAVREHSIRFTGTRDHARTVISSLGRSRFADVPSAKPTVTTETPRGEADAGPTPGGLGHRTMSRPAVPHAVVDLITVSAAGATEGPG